MEKKAQTGLQTLSALELFARWLEEETANSKIRQVLVVLALQTKYALERGYSPPVAEVVQLAAWRRDHFGGRPTEEDVTGKWMPSSSVQTWWKNRENSRQQFFQEAGATLDVDLVIQQGGGRGNPTTYQLRFSPADPPPLETPLELELAASGTVPERIVYQHEPARASWFLAPILNRPFSMRSWKGALFILVVAAPFLVAVACSWLTIFYVLSRQGHIPAFVGSAAFIGTFAAMLTWGFRPLWQLPTLRVTIARDWMLGLNQWYGQFRLSHDSDGKTKGRFSLVRFFATCPICAGSVEIRERNAAFPGRLVGCCSDNPREHVYSFDAVTFSGRLLIVR
ncbi:hypothetical protein CH75_24075 [Dyella jiangningensis]|nr:hypothetical protein CH75_00995 [Dyella jiangningensis]AHX16503.1 hypothetical protein CH75_24075 [Dyella jiangningensis]